MLAPPPCPSRLDVWIFDLDDTLYPASSGVFAEMRARMERYVADLYGIDLADAVVARRELVRRHGTALRGLMRERGVDPIAFMDYVHDVDLSPLAPCARLDAALRRLPGRKLIYTNGSVAHAERVLERLGLQDHFAETFDIAAAGYEPKPEPAPYVRMAARHGVAPRRAAMVEDRAANLAPAHALGMTTIWVRPENDPSAAAPNHVHHAVEDLTGWLEALVSGQG